MIKNFLADKITENFTHNPTNDQSLAIKKLSDFILSSEANSIFLLKGYAGTGKTSLIGALVRTLTELGNKTVLMAPTGRAAKVFSSYANAKAFTIHKKIYRQKSFNGESTGFQETDNLYKDTLFLVDEASMIANGSADSMVFGSGQLLNDLIHFVYSGERCRMILMGDTAQLPPVMQKESPALNAGYLKQYGLTVQQTELKQIVRQDEGSGILYNATLLREALATGVVDKYPKLHLSSFSDLRKVNGEDLIDEISSAYNRDGIEETMIITRSNKRAVIFNNGIRSRILYREEELSSGDLLMVAHNNYFWKANDDKVTDFIANGEIIQVLRVHRTEELYGFRFIDALIRFQEDEREVEVKLLADTLQTDTPSLNKETSDKLFNAVWEDYADETNKRERMKKLKSDAYFNVLQVKYAYAVTCHKAQGGQWSNVFLDIGYMTEEMLGEDFYRWLYTAFTRATKHLYLVNLPHEFEE